MTACQHSRTEGISVNTPLPFPNRWRSPTLWTRNGLFAETHVCMSVAPTDGRIAGQSDARTEVPIDGLNDGHYDNRTSGLVAGGTDQHNEGPVGGQAVGYTDGLVGGHVGDYRNGYTDGRVGDPRDGRTDGHTKDHPVVPGIGRLDTPEDGLHFVHSDDPVGGLPAARPDGLMEDLAPDLRVDRIGYPKSVQTGDPNFVRYDQTDYGLFPDEPLVI